MDQKFFHGALTPEDLCHALDAHFHRGNYRVQRFGDEERQIVQIASSAMASSGGQTAITISCQKVEDGVMVSVGKQAWFGVAASLGVTALAALRNPFSLLGRLDDLAQDIESLQLSDQIWQVLNQTAASLGAGVQLSEKYRRIVCSFCGSANPVGVPTCVACGAPAGDIQPIACPTCGYLLTMGESHCPNCKNLIPGK